MEHIVASAAAIAFCEISLLLVSVPETEEAGTKSCVRILRTVRSSTDAASSVQRVCVRAVADRSGGQPKVAGGQVSVAKACDSSGIPAF